MRGGIFVPGGLFSIGEAAKKATRYIIDYLVDVPHMLVTMHTPKHIFMQTTPKG